MGRDKDKITISERALSPDAYSNTFFPQSFRILFDFFYFIFFEDLTQKKRRSQNGSSEGPFSCPQNRPLCGTILAPLCDMEPFAKEEPFSKMAPLRHHFGSTFFLSVQNPLNVVVTGQLVLITLVHLISHPIDLYILFYYYVNVSRTLHSPS